MNWKAPYHWLRRRAGLNSKGIRHTDLSSCLNCSETLHEEDLYCKSCGQKVHVSKLTVGMLVSEFFAGIFNLENGFYKSLTRIIFPAYLSTQFLEGKRKSYLNPIRFFVITLIVFLAAINYVIDLDDLGNLSNTTLENIGKSKIYDEFLIQKDSLLRSGNIAYSEIDSLESALFRDIVPSKYDTLGLGMGNVGSFDISQFNFSRIEIYELPISEVLATHNIEKRFERFIVTQVLRTFRNPEGAVRFLIGNILWSVVISVILLGFLNKVLYMRSKRYYVEHFIVLCHIHAFAFIVSTISILLWKTESDSAEFNVELPQIGPVAFIIIAGYFLLSLKKYYSQGWIKTIIKFFIIGFSGFTIFCLITVVTALVSIALFR